MAASVNKPFSNHFLFFLFIRKHIRNLRRYNPLIFPCFTGKLQTCPATSTNVTSRPCCADM